MKTKKTLLVDALKVVVFFSQAALFSQQHVNNMSMHGALMREKKSMDHKNIQFAATAPSDRLLSRGE